MNPLYNEEIEQHFLGCLLADDAVYDDVSRVRPEQFYNAVHGRIFEHIRKFKDAGKNVTPHQVSQYFANDPDLSEAGGATYIHDLTANVITTTAAKAHAEHICEMHLRRAIRALSGNLLELAEKPDIEVSPKQLLAQAEKFIYEAAETGSENTIRHIAECTRKTIEQMNKKETGIRTGIPKLDASIRGFKPGELYIIAGRPGMGKTAMGLTLAVNVAIAHHKPMFFSLEMPFEQLTQRLLSRISGECVHSGEAYDAYKVQEAARTLEALPLYIEDKSGLTVSDIASRARRHKRKHGLDILFIDYLGYILPEDRRANKVHQVGEITANLKRLSKDLMIPVVLLCQLSRAVEHRDNKRPCLADLRDSGEIEQDADVVMFVYREEYYQSEANAAPAGTQSGFKGGREKQAAQLADVEALKGKAEVIIAKNRQSRTGTLHLNFDARRQFFHD